jgi:hypothetical protein
VNLGNLGVYLSLGPVAVGDVNGDGKPDLAAAIIGNVLGVSGATPPPGYVVVLQGNCDGTFQQPSAKLDTGTNVLSLALADVNRDGKLDLIATHQDNTISVLLGDGRGGFSAAPGSPISFASVPGFISGLAVADFNGDGTPDIAVALSIFSGTGNAVNVLLGDGAGHFTPAAGSPIGVGVDPSNLIAGDFNRDGKPDLALLNFKPDFTPFITVLLGDGRGGFTAVTTTVPPGPAGIAFLPGDFTGDGTLDLALLDSAGLNVLPGKGDGTFGPAITTNSLVNGFLRAVGDFNDDGKLDLLVVNFAPGAVLGTETWLSVLPGNGDGTFQPGVNFDLGGANPLSLPVADLNGDGRPDLVFGTSSLPAVDISVLPGQSSTGTASQRFVTQVYRDLLNRPPEPGGLAFWTGLLDQGTLNRAQVVQGITASQEYHTIIVAGLYNHLLRRAADSFGLSTFVSFLGAGGTVEQVASLIAGSPEYVHNHASGAPDFIQALYEDALGRVDDPSGRATFSALLAAGVSPAQVAAMIYGSTEYQQHLVLRDYLRYLGRWADEGGFNGFVGALQAGATDEQVLAAILGSDEYFARLTSLG